LPHCQKWRGWGIFNKRNYGLLAEAASINVDGSRKKQSEVSHHVVSSEEIFRLWEEAR
jgi:hypothetical protein